MKAKVLYVGPVALRGLFLRLYNCGYVAGHTDTEGGVFKPIFDLDWDSRHDIVVEDFCSRYFEKHHIEEAPMSIEKKEYFVTSDGRAFATQTEAEDHEAMGARNEAIKGFLENGPGVKYTDRSKATAARHIWAFMEYYRINSVPMVG